MDVLTVGGTEVLLAGTIPKLTNYNHVLVYLHGENKFQNEFKDIPVICLGHKGKLSIFRSVRRLRKIIKEYRVDIVHAHLIWSRFLAALAKPKLVKLLGSLHSVFSEDALAKNKKALWMEKYTARRLDGLIGVSQFVIDDYVKHIPYKGKTHLLYNFIPGVYFEESKHTETFFPDDGVIKCVAVGNLKSVKNYQYILSAFEQLPEGQFQLDIIGEGQTKESMKQFVSEKKLPVRFLSGYRNLGKLLSEYHVFIQASKHEGFGLAVAEGVASGLVPVLSNIPVHKEITNGQAIYFDLDSPANLTQALLTLRQKPIDREKLQQVSEHVRKITNEESYMERLNKIYQLYL